MKRIPKEEQQKIIDTIRTIPPLNEQEIQEAVQALSIMDWDAPIFKRKDWVYTALQLYNANQLDSMQMAHLFLYDACKKIPSFQCYTATSAITCLEILRRGFSRIKDLEMDRAILDLEKTPMNLQVFSYRVPIISSTKNTDENTFHNSVFRRFSFTPTIEHEASQELEILIFPPQQLLKNRFELSMTPVPVLGYSPREIFSNPNERVMSIPSRFTPTIELHSIQCPGTLLVYFHDMYHLFVESGNPHRRAWIEFASFLRQLQIDSDKRFDPKIVEIVRQKCLDRDIPSYVQELLALNSKKLDSAAAAKIFFSRLWVLFNPIDDRFFEWEKGLYLEMLSYIRNNQEKWKSLYGLEIPVR